ncbi:MAG: hypothetical protein IPJ11_00845 [Gemmatimonadetes bacterium]|nr:hypothetical protein [Gemmatimonadota bacterium]
MFGNLGGAELLIILGVFAVPVAAGWLLIRAWDRRDSAARDLHRLSAEVAALAEQNFLLADELAELAAEAKASARLAATDRPPRAGASLTHPPTA